MTLIAASVTVDRADLVDSAIERAQRARDDGADVVEWRVDLLATPGGDSDAIAELCRRTPLPCIVTVRSEAEGGAFTGSAVSSVRALLPAIGGDHPPRWIDVESSTLRDQRAHNELREALQRVPESTRPSLIVSAHDFAGRPAGLWSTVERMWGDPECHVAKIAWMARSVRDNLEAFEVLDARQGPTIALCMGEHGVLSRVMGARHGAFLTFARLDDEVGSAPGQPTVSELVSRYRVESITKHTRVYGVIGWPVSHSRSPEIHNEFFARDAVDARYLPLPVGPSWESFKATVGELIDHPTVGFAGASVTLPHKEHLVQFVRERGGTLDDASSMIGAANTLLVDPQSRALRACNTDALAGVESMAQALRRPSDDLRGMRVAILGAGGVARALAWSCADAGADVTIVNRTPDRARALVDDLHDRPGAWGPMRVAVGRDDALTTGAFDAIVNATPLGMKDGPSPAACALPSDALLDGVVVMDTVYSPEETPLVRLAMARGARVVTGLGMFLRQAALQYELWTGKRPCTDSLRAR